MKKIKKKGNALFPKPFGASDIFHSGNTGDGTIVAITCELCGTLHPRQREGDNGYSIFSLLGREGVMECCGAAVDQLYKEWGAQFTERFLEKFSEAPLDSRFQALRNSITLSIHAWLNAASRQEQVAQQLMEIIPS